MAFPVPLSTKADQEITFPARNLRKLGRKRQFLSSFHENLTRKCLFPSGKRLSCSGKCLFLVSLLRSCLGKHTSWTDFGKAGRRIKIPVQEFEEALKKITFSGRLSRKTARKSRFLSSFCGNHTEKDNSRLAIAIFPLSQFFPPRLYTSMGLSRLRPATKLTSSGASNQGACRIEWPVRNGGWWTDTHRGRHIQNR
jgi:hypothetical protein